MKVTVCFGNIRVVVPCGKGDVSVRDLQEKACSRYRKAIGKETDYFVRIHQLESATDGGILDGDDLVYDVVEDKEKLVAIFEEEEPFHSDWDLGSVASSEGKNTPQRPVYRGHISGIASNGGSQSQIYQENKDQINSSYNRDSSLEVDVCTEALKSNTQIVVRSQPLDGDSFYTSYNYNTSSSQSNMSESSLGTKKTVKPLEQNISASKKLLESTNSREKSYFRRDTAARQSMGSGLSESVENEPPYNSGYPAYDYSLLHNGMDRREQTNDGHKTNQRSGLPWFYRDSQEMCLVNDGSLNGIQVSSFIDDNTNKFAGLLIKSIDQSSRIGCENVLSIGDIIVEINEHILMDFAFDDAEAMLRESLNRHQIQLRVLPVEEREREPDRPHSNNNCNSYNQPTVSLTSATPPSVSTNQSARGDPSSLSLLPHESQSSPSKPPAVAQLSFDNVSKYTKKIGSRINVQLTKDIHGLGFTLTTRDTTLGEVGPIYIKTILPKGAAIKDGRLQAGDRLLEVDGENMVGKTQDEAVSMLRSFSIGSTVNVTISRQTENLPRKLKDDPDTDRIISDDQLKEYFVFDIPLNDTGSAGLGISLKGNQSKRTHKDLGIFVKAVFHGGAAWQDGRLQPNDQLIRVNGHSLQGVSNREAIDILRCSMSTEGNVRGMIEMVIARRKIAPDGTTSRVSSEASSDLSDSFLDHFQGTARQANELSGDSEQMDIQEPNRITDRNTANSPTKNELTSPSNPDVVITDEELSDELGSYQPFSRESTMRQSISEKRRDTVPRYKSSQNILDDSSSEQGSKKDQQIDPTTSNPGSNKKHSKSSTSAKRGSSQKNNNNSTFAWRVPQTNFRKSISTESLVAGSNAVDNHDERSSDLAANNVDVGPTLGIAKSSSLESLQTAVESYVAEKSNDSIIPLPRPLPKQVVRGRVLNDSFRAALDRSYDLTQESSTLKPMSPSYQDQVQEETLDSACLSPPNDDGSRKKRSKLFGIFKINKSKKPEQNSTNVPKVSESQLHKRDLEARREKDFERMKEENERIQAKARELRHKQREEILKHENRSNSYERPRPPSVPVTAMQRIDSTEDKSRHSDTISGRRSVDPYVAIQHHYKQRNSGGKDDWESAPPPPPRGKRRGKLENKKYKDSINAYSSLPRQPRRDQESQEMIATPSSQVDRGFSSLRHDFNNLDFYNRQKPPARRKRIDEVQFESNPITDPSTASPFADYSRTSNFEDNEEHFYFRENSSEPSGQDFYVVQNKRSSPVVIMRKNERTTPRSSQPSSFRHSLYTENQSPMNPVHLHYTPSHSTSSRSHRGTSQQRLYDAAGEDSLSSADSNRTDSPTSSEIAERNRRTYHKLMQPQMRGKLEDSYEKIEVSMPYNL